MSVRVMRVGKTDSLAVSVRGHQYGQRQVQTAGAGHAGGGWVGVREEVRMRVGRRGMVEWRDREEESHVTWNGMQSVIVLALV